MIGVGHFTILSGVLFVVGGVGFLVRRNVLVTLMSIEVMLNSANLAFVAFSRHHGNLQGQVFTFFVIAVAAAEAAVALAILIALFRLKGGINLDDASELKG